MKGNRVLGLWVVVVVLPVVVLGLPSVSGAIEYEIIDLRTWESPLPQSEALAINESGQIAGTSRTLDATYHAFLYENGVMSDLGFVGNAYGISNGGHIVGRLGGTSPGNAFLYDGGSVIDLGTLGGDRSVAYSINEVGEIVGESRVSTGSAYEHAFIYQNGMMSDLGTLGGTDSYAYAINNSGEIVGGSHNDAGAFRAFLHDDGAWTDLGTLGGLNSQAFAINENGWIVGVADTASGESHAFLYKDGEMTDLGTLGETESYAFGINNNGQIVGWAGSPGHIHAFLWEDETMIDLGTLPGGTFSEARAINDDGWIVGIADVESGDRHAVLWMPKVIYVDDSSTNGLNDGTSWADAFLDLQDGLDVATNGDEIRVAQGTYKPDRGTYDRFATFQLGNGVALYGGYAGHGAPDPNERDIELHETILSGDLFGDDGPDFANRMDNSRDVVTAESVDASAVLDGFVITAGNDVRDWGGGMRIDVGTPMIRSCTFTDNIGHVGGGLSGDNADATLISCKFVGNRAINIDLGGGGGAYFKDSSPTIIDCTFIDNQSANRGGGIEFDGSDHTWKLDNCIFIDNWADTYGGGMYSRNGSSFLVNCVFNGNISVWNGGGMHNANYHGSALVNCTFAGNWAWDGDGGGIWQIAGTGDPLTTLWNSILWGNLDRGGSDEGAQIHGTSASAVNPNYCCIQGWTGSLGGVGNIGDDPLFVEADGFPGVQGDLRLSPGSPCIDAGDNDAVPLEVTTDLDGNPRFVDDPSTPDTGNGIPPIVDMGAYEFDLEDCNSNGFPDANDVAVGTSQDCNTNMIPDECDVAEGTSDDCDSNGVPDECEDCNTNGLADACDLVGGTSQDCNTNDLPDECDITHGTSLDCHDDGTPDECQLVGNDCNSNQVPDDCEMGSNDCNTDGIPDDCQLDGNDCNLNGVPDECELSPMVPLQEADFEGGLPDGWTVSGLWHVTDQCSLAGACDASWWAYFGQDGACDFDTGTVVGELAAPGVLIPPNAVSANLTYCSLYEGDRGSAAIPFGFDLAWVTVNGVLVDDVGPTPALGEWETRAVDLTAFIGQTVTIAWNFDSVDAVSNDGLGWQVDAIELVAFTDNDCNTNGLPDECEDCNSNTFADECDIEAGTSEDCNSNGAPDECDVAVEDCNTNGVPDDCDPDWDGDGVPDDCDPDIDGDGVPNGTDVCPYSLPGEMVNPSGGPMGDFDDDCAVTLDDYFYFEICLYLSGPDGDPGFDDCYEVFDFDGDDDTDLADYASFERGFTGPLP